MGVRAFVKKVKRTFPEVLCQMSKPLNQGGVWFVDFIRGTCHVVFQHRPGEWGLTKITPENEDEFTNKPEELFTDEDHAFIRIIEMLARPTENHEMRAFVTLSDQLWRETHDNFLSAAMIELRDKMIEKLVIRGNDGYFERRKVGPFVWNPTLKTMVPVEDPQREVRIEIQCEPGWYRIIGDCIERMVAETHSMEWKDYRLKFTCVKEKFAGLRIYFNITHKNGDEIPSETMQMLYDSLSSHIAVAETLCHNICEVCGEPGRIRGQQGEHLQTLCDYHTKLRGRSEPEPVTKALFGSQVDAVDFLKLTQQEQNDELRIRGNGSTQDGPQSPA